MRRVNMIKANILLVDDDQNYVGTLTKRLSKRGLNVAKAGSGNAALEYIHVHSETEVVILDVKMPGMDGRQVLKEIKGRYPLIEVIMLTGHSAALSGIEGMKLGACDFLTKPCDLDLLMAKVDEAVSKKRRHEEKIREATLKEITDSSLH